MRLVPVARVRNIRNVMEGDMNEKKTDSIEEKFQQLDIRVADTMFRLTALEQLLLSKGIITESELSEIAERMIERLTKLVIDGLDKTNNLNEFIAYLGGSLRKELKS
jgi:hypothetical protein